MKDPVTTKKKKPFSGSKSIKPLKIEKEFEPHCFTCDVSGDLIFMGRWHGGLSIEARHEGVCEMDERKKVI